MSKTLDIITNMDCTSRVGQGTKNSNKGVVKYDHKNFADYRLYTPVVNYDDKSRYYGGCMCSFNRAAGDPSLPNEEPDKN